MSQELDVVISNLTASITAQDTVVGSAESLLAGLSSALAAAMAQAANAGMTDVQAAAFHDLQTTIDAKSAELAAAVAANTPAAPPAGP